MKKSNIVITVAGVTLAGWVYMSWNTGKIIEKDLPEYVQYINTKIITQIPYNKTGFNNLVKLPEFKLVKFNRGIFSSKILFSLSYDNATLPLSANVSHGPFPLASLSHFSFKPKLASVNIMLVADNPMVQMAKKMLTNGKEPFIIDLDLYTEYMGFNGKFATINMKDAHTNILVKGIEFSGKVKNNLDTISSTFKIDDLYINVGVLKFLLSCLKYNNNNNRFPNHPNQQPLNIYTGNEHFDLNVFSINGANSLDFPNMDLNQVHINSSSIPKGNNYEGQSTFQFGGLIVNQANFGTIKFNTNFNNINAQGFSVLLDLYNQLLLGDTKYLTDKRFNEGITKILENNPTFSIPSFHWKNNQGELNASFDLQMKNGKLTSPKDIIKLIKFKLNAQRSMLEYSLANLISLKNNSMKPSQILQLVKEMFNSLQQAKMNKDDTVYSRENLLSMLIDIDDKTLHSDLFYENDLFSINGHSIKAETFLDAFNR